MDIATIATVLAALRVSWPQTRRPFIRVQCIPREPRSPLRPDRTGHALKPGAAPRPVSRSSGRGWTACSSARHSKAATEANRSTGPFSSAWPPVTARPRPRAWRCLWGSPPPWSPMPRSRSSAWARTANTCTAEQMHRFTLTSLHGAFATVRRAIEVLGQIGALGTAHSAHGLV